MNIVLHAQLIALLANYVLQFGNEMLLTSFYASSLLSVLAIVNLEDKIEGGIKNLVLRCVAKVSSWNGPGKQLNKFTENVLIHNFVNKMDFKLPLPIFC